MEKEVIISIDHGYKISILTIKYKYIEQKRQYLIDRGIQVLIDDVEKQYIQVKRY